MSILNSKSLSATIDNVNVADFYGAPLKKQDCRDAIAWILTRFEAPSAYGRTFGITRQDESERLCTFTGEGLVSDASMRHVHAEEACRALIVLNRVAKLNIPELELASQFLLSCIVRSENAGKPAGTYCCGPCTVSLWRHMAVGGLADYSKKLNLGVGVLQTYRDSKGTWGRFPFYYTLLALSEIDLANARKEIRYALPECKRKLKTLRASSRFSRRKADLLTRILQKHM